MVLLTVYETTNKLLSDNPSYTTKITRPLQPEYLPSIQICPQPGWNLEKLKKVGYSDLFYYYFGDIQCESKDGDISEDCPKSWRGKYNNISYQQLSTVSNITDFIEDILIEFEPHDNIEYTREKINKSKKCSKLRLLE